MVTNDVVKQEFNIFGDVWKFYKTFYGVTEEWEPVLNTAREISKKYNDNPFCNELLVNTISQLERISKEKAANKL